MYGYNGKELEIAFHEERPLQLIYMDSDGEISQRVIKVMELREDGVQAYCFMRREPRTFRRENILAASLQVPRGYTSSRRTYSQQGKGNSYGTA